MEGSPNTFPAESAIFGVVTRCISVEVDRLFEGNHRFHLQGRKTKYETNIFIASFLLGLLFDSEDGGDTCLGNVR
jgi:hypothetical protein